MVHCHIKWCKSQVVLGGEIKSGSTNPVIQNLSCRKLSFLLYDDDDDDDDAIAMHMHL